MIVALAVYLRKNCNLRTTYTLLCVIFHKVCVQNFNTYAYAMHTERMCAFFWISQIHLMIHKNLSIQKIYVWCFQSEDSMKFASSKVMHSYDSTWACFRSLIFCHLSVRCQIHPYQYQYQPKISCHNKTGKMFAGKMLQIHFVFECNIIRAAAELYIQYLGYKWI